MYRDNCKLLIFLLLFLLLLKIRFYAPFCAEIRRSERIKRCSFYYPWYAHCWTNRQTRKATSKYTKIISISQTGLQMSFMGFGLLLCLIFIFLFWLWKVNGSHALCKSTKFYCSTCTNKALHSTYTCFSLNWKIAVFRKINRQYGKIATGNDEMVTICFQAIFVSCVCVFSISCFQWIF